MIKLRPRACGKRGEFPSGRAGALYVPAHKGVRTDFILI